MKYLKLKISVLSLITIIFGLENPSSVWANYSPPAKVTFTFDDGTKNVYTKAAPLFEAHGMPAVVYGETFWLTSGQDWVMTWGELRDLRDRLGWEIGSHTINHVDLTKTTDAQLENELLGSKQTFAQNGINTTAFSSPVGAYDTRVLRAVAKYYSSHRMAWGGPNVWPDIYNDYELSVLEAKHTSSPEEVMGWIDSAVQNRQWLVLLFHDVVEGTPQEYEYNVNDLKKIVDYTAQRPMQVVTTTKGLEHGSGNNLINNGSFEQTSNGFANGWSRSHTNPITINTATRGNFPQPKNSLRIVGGTQQREAISDFIAINSNNTYLFKMHADGSQYTRGGWGVWMGEYDSNNVLLGGRWIGGKYQPFFGSSYFEYSPSSTNVSKVKVHIYTEANSSLTLLADSVELKVAGGQVPPSVTVTPTTVLPTPTQIAPSPTNAPLPTPTSLPSLTPTSIVPTATPTNTPSGPNLLFNGSFEETSGGFATGWSQEGNSAISIDTNNNGYAPSPKNSLKIIGGAGQNTAVSNLTDITDSSATHELSYFLKTVGFSGGGSAAYIDEFDASGNWTSGKWLGGQYAATNGIVKYDYKPTSLTVKKIQVHLFTEDQSPMTAYFDEARLVKK